MLQEAGNYTELLVLQEEAKTLPFGDIWNEYLSREGMNDDYFSEIAEYEKNVLLNR